MFYMIEEISLNVVYISFGQYWQETYLEIQSKVYGRTLFGKIFNNF